MTIRQQYKEYVRQLSFTMIGNANVCIQCGTKRYFAFMPNIYCYNIDSKYGPHFYTLDLDYSCAAVCPKCEQAIKDNENDQKVKTKIAEIKADELSERRRLYECFRLARLNQIYLDINAAICKENQDPDDVEHYKSMLNRVQTEIDFIENNVRQLKLYNDC